MIEQAPEPEPRAKPRLSVVIPTFNRASLLADVLADLDRQTALPGEGRYEVIVVDDGSTDATPEVLAISHPAQYRLRVLHQANAGLNAARNAGAAAAEAALVAFLDDDVAVPETYVGAMLEAFRVHEDAAGVAGQVTLRFEAPRPRWLTDSLAEYLTTFDARRHPGWLEPPGAPRGANFALRRSAWAAAGGFRAGLDRRGTSLVSSGEVELFGRLHAAGGRFVACPEAEVFHRVGAERLTIGWFGRRAWAQGVSDVMLVPPKGGWPARAQQLVREVWRAGRTGPILAKALAARRGPEHAAVWLSYCGGRVSAILAPPGR